MRYLIITTVFAAAMTLPGCSRHESIPEDPVVSANEAESPAAHVTFTNRVWVVAESEQVEAGALRVFLSEGTLVMASPHATPALGTWIYEDGRLRITEEGRTYEVDILELTRDTFRVRILSPGEPVEIRFASANATPLPDLTGTWTVVGHHIPGISAMNDAEATAWHGRTVRLTTEQAISSGGDRCDAPSYVTRSVERDRLASEYRLPPGALAPLADQEYLTVLDVHCGGTRWVVPGGRLLGIDANRALSPWDGVFFELARDHQAPGALLPDTDHMPQVQIRARAAAFEPGRP